MKREEVILEFSKDIFDEYKRKNAVTITNIKHSPDRSSNAPCICK